MNYESKVRRGARSLESRRNWEGVFALYQEATDKLPNSMVLLRASEAALSRYNTMIDKAKGIALTNKAKLIIKDRSTYKRLLALNPSDKGLKLNVIRNQQDAEILARDLNLLGDRAQVRQQSENARKYWNYSYQLTPSKAIKLRLGALPKKAFVKRIFSNKKKSGNETVKLDFYKQILKEGDFLMAQSLMDEIWARDPDNEEVQLLQTQLQVEIELYVREQSQLAEQLYSQGEYDEARKIWLSVLPLDPENLRVKADIARTERVLANIEELRKRQ